MTTRTAPVYSEATAAKAERLIATGAVQLARRYPDGSARYTVAGDTATHRVTVGADGIPDLCDCPARSRCAHQAAAAAHHRQGAPPPMPDHPAQQDLEPGGNHPGDPEPPQAATAPAPTKPADPDPASGPAPGPGHDRTAANQVEPAEAEAPPRGGTTTPAEPLEAEALEAEALEDGDQAEPEAIEVDADIDYTPAPALATAAAGEIDVATAAVTWRTLTALSQTEFVPAALAGRPGAVLGAVLLGREYGLGPLEALRQITVIDGSPSPSAELQLRLYRRAGHRLEVTRADDQAVEITGTRTDTGDTMTVTFTIEDAERAGLLAITADGAPVARSRQGKPMPWEHYTADLLWARAVTRLVRRLAPDALDHPPAHHHDQEDPR